MKKALIDTDILSYFLKGDSKVVQNFGFYLDKFQQLNFSIITYYEIYSGLKYKDSKKLINSFLDFSNYNKIIPLSKKSVEISADIYSELRKTGKPIDDIDLLIAGIAISNDMKLITHNTRHFKRIKNLTVIDWFEKVEF
ncbi:MAG: type II toxin-antitoxin system VapC family toxin [Fidelibacterota bacterium]